MQVGTAQVDDIYGTSTHPREVYTLAADVRQGNSGGPVLTLDGTVAGGVRPQRGYRECRVCDDDGRTRPGGGRSVHPHRDGLKRGLHLRLTAERGAPIPAR